MFPANKVITSPTVSKRTAWGVDPCFKVKSLEPSDCFSCLSSCERECVLSLWTHRLFRFYTPCVCVLAEGVNTLSPPSQWAHSSFFHLAGKSRPFRAHITPLSMTQSVWEYSQTIPGNLHPFPNEVIYLNSIWYHASGEIAWKWSVPSQNLDSNWPEGGDLWQQGKGGKKKKVSHTRWPL